MGKVYGIDLGTTYSAIATLDDRGMPEVIENFADSVPLLASAVYFPETGDPVIGKEAKNQAEIEPDKVVQFIKREIGKSDATPRNFNGIDYDPITISALILKRMKEYAEEQGHEVSDVVITCPAYFGTEERNATKQAGIIAGLNVLNIVNEPTAAALNYCCREFQENRKIMVYDLGGGTFDITLFNFGVNEAGESSIEVLKTGGDDRLGGVDWDARLFDYICEQYTDENGVTLDEMDAELRQKIRSQVEDVKKSLSNMPTKSFTINYSGDSTRIEVTRDKFVELTQDLVARTMDFVTQLLEDAAVSADEVDTVLLVGGSTLMPMIKDAMDAVFPNKVRREEPNLAVAKGAALAAAIAWNEQVMEEKKQRQDNTVPNEDGGVPVEPIEEKETINVLGNISSGEKGIFQDVLSRSFGPAIRNENGEYVIDNLLFVGDPSPAQVSKVYGTMVDNQTMVQIPVFENVATDHDNTYVTPSLNERDEEQYTDPALKVKYLGVLEFELPPNTPKGSPIEVIFDFGTSGLNVTAINQATGQPVSAQIVSSNTKTQEELEQDARRLSSMHTTGQI